MIRTDSRSVGEPGQAINSVVAQFPSISAAIHSTPEIVYRVTGYRVKSPSQITNHMVDIPTNQQGK